MEVGVWVVVVLCDVCCLFFLFCLLCVVLFVLVVRIVRLLILMMWVGVLVFCLVLCGWISLRVCRIGCGGGCSLWFLCRLCWCLVVVGMFGWWGCVK